MISLVFCIIMIYLTKTASIRMPRINGNARSFRKQTYALQPPFSLGFSGLGVSHEPEGKHNVKEQKEILLRFWSHKIKIESHEEKLNKRDAIDSIVRQVQASHETSRVANGIAMTKLPGDKDENLMLMIPVQNGVAQPQHLVYARESEFHTLDSIFLCAFNPRAQPNEMSPSEEERPINAERLEALNLELKLLNIDSADLVGSGLAGTSPAKIYRSFVCPRPNRVHLLERVERAAKRTASQIELSLRQVRADQAAYLRNTDRSDLQVLDKGRASSTRMTHPVALLLDNVRSAFNVGSLFRTGETAGVAEIVTAGITASPPHPKLRKTAMQSLENVPTRHYDDVIEAVSALKEEGYTICVMETTTNSQVYTSATYPEKTCLVLGNEITGVDTRIMEQADMIVEIPTFGVKNSLNVASAGPIVLFEVLRQWTANNTDGQG